MNKKPEIMAPVGNYESLASAIKAGADSVYFGIGKLNMRSRSSVNFTSRDLKKIVRICKAHNIRTYLTLNTVMYDQDLIEIKRVCNKAKKLGINAIIACDIAVMQYCRKIGLEVHMSTQANISNIQAVKFYSKFADVVVLARELTLEQIAKIIKQIKKQDIRGPSGKLIKIEIFIHGALCVSISGKCYMSLAQHNFSANRGACLQPCRREYIVKDKETGDELIVGNKYIMSPKDLCTIRFIDKIIKAGVRVFKIEGRGRSPDYVYTVVKAYKQAVDSYFENKLTKELIINLERQLASVFNRGFWHGGYYLGKKLGDWAGDYGSKATTEKHFIGLVKHFYPKVHVAEIVLQKEKIKVGDKILITGNTTGIIKTEVGSVFVKEKPKKIAKKGDVDVTISVPEKVRKGDKIYVLKKKGVNSP